MIKKILLYNTELPLKTPYVSSLAALEIFSSLFVFVEDEDGRSGMGECCAVPGYSPETPDQAWSFAKELAPRLSGQSVEDALRMLPVYQKNYPFACTAFFSALEELAGRPCLLPPEQEIIFPIVGIVNPDAGESLEEHVERRIAEGFTTLKVKAGFDAEHDIAKVSHIQELADGRACIRIDANQGYNYSDALRFVTGLDPQGIELFEQPFAPDGWDSMIKLASASELPLMLDESIYGIDEVKRAGESKCADFLKFKLMKSASVDRLSDEISLAKQYGMKLVIGNGVASDIGCYQETLAGARCGVVTAGEQNGFLKPTVSVLKQPLTFRSGSIVIEPGFRPEVDWEVLKMFAIDSLCVNAN